MKIAASKYFSFWCIIIGSILAVDGHNEFVLVNIGAGMDRKMIQTFSDKMDFTGHFELGAYLIESMENSPTKTVAGSGYSGGILGSEGLFVGYVERNSILPKNIFYKRVPIFIHGISYGIEAGYDKNNAGLITISPEFRYWITIVPFGSIHVKAELKDFYNPKVYFGYFFKIGIPLYYDHAANPEPIKND